MDFEFKAGVKDPGTRARRGTFVTAHGPVETPAFMPVGTRATVTGLDPRDLREMHAQIILGNTYHLMLRPGPEVFRHFGGIQKFMRWDGPVLTDSGGFQIFSLSKDRDITEEGARFRSYVDGAEHLLTPERSIQMQEAIGSDVMMVLDVCLPSTAAPDEIRAAMDRTHRWAARSLAARTSRNALFAIVQGGLDPALRRESARVLTAMPFDGFAIGGLAVGDTRAERTDVIALAADSLPEGKPRYLMGVGTPPDILESIARGVDMFDCILPTALAWQGTAFTSRGRVRVDRGEYRLSDDSLDPACACATCTQYARGYLHHLMKCKEPLAPRLLAIHNLTHYLDLTRAARTAIDEGRYAQFMKETLEAIDRHEHGEAAPGRKPGQPLAPERHTVVLTTSGEPSVRDLHAHETMHPVVGARRESESLYAAQSRLREKLLDVTAREPLVLFDVGLGAASNALAARRISEALPEGARRLVIVSFEEDLGALSLALRPGHAAAFGLDGEAGEAARALISRGVHETPRTHWRLVKGDALFALESRAAAALAEVVYWDPFSPKTNPALWSVRAFSALRRNCGPRATLFTYSASTPVRAALLIAGFAVGAGEGTGQQRETTCAAVDPASLALPLGARFLARLSRSSAPLPRDAPADALEKIGGMAQFAPTVAAPGL